MIKLDCMAQKQLCPEKQTRIQGTISVKVDILKTALPAEHTPTYCSEQTATWLNTWFAILPVFAISVHFTACNSLEFSRAPRSSEEEPKTP